MRCQHYEASARCRDDAVGTLNAPDGKAVPGGGYCRPHAEAVIEEYRAKLGEVWTFSVHGDEAEVAR